MGENRTGRCLWLFAALAGLLVLVAGCSTNDDGETKKNAEEVLKFVWWGGDQRKENTLKVIELFEKANPGVKIEAVPLSNTSDVSKEAVMGYGRGEAPDIIQGDYGFIFNFINRKLFEPLDTYAENGALDLTDVESEFLAPGRAADGKLYAVNLGNNSQTFLINTKVFADTKIELLQDGYTLDDLYATLKEMKARNKTPGFAPLGAMIDMTYYMRARGVSLYNSEGTGLGYQDDQIMADYLRLQKKWTDEGLIYKGGSVSNNKNHPLVTGLTAIYPVVTNQAATISSFTSDSLKLIHYPVIDPKYEGKFLKPSMFLSVSAYSKHKEAAAKFISFFINNPEANDILNGERGVPVATKIAARLFAKQNAANQEQYLYIENLKTQVKPIDPPVPSSSTSVNNAYNRVKNKVLAGTITPEEGAAEYRSDAAKILNRGRAE